MSSLLWSLLGRSTQTSDAVNPMPEGAGSTSTNKHTEKDKKPFDNEHKGNQIKAKAENILRICHININGVTQTTKNPKNQHIREFINTYELDHVGLAETNCNWSNMEEQDQWHNRVQNWWNRSKSVVAHNSADIGAEIKQPGGVINMSMAGTASSAIDSGIDSPLGRWAWTTLRGKNKIHTTIISGYRPCRNLKDDNSTYNQQLRYFVAKGIDKCPRQIWLEDMERFIKEKQTKGHQIILLADMNEDVEEDMMIGWARKVKLKEVVSKTTSEKVATHNKGSAPIDGIFLSYTLSATRAGYFPFGSIQSDHRALWVDIERDLILGFKPPTNNPTTMRRLQCNLPHVRDSWRRHYTNFLQKNNLINRQIKLESNISLGVLTKAQAKEYEKILQQRNEGIAYADHRCRKLKCGQVPYSPECQKARLSIELWKAASTIKRGCRYSSKLFRRLSKKVGIQNVLQNTLQMIKTKEDEAWKLYW